MRGLDRLDDTPAMVQTDLLETLAMNPLAAALLGDLTRHTGLARSGFYRTLGRIEVDGHFLFTENRAQVGMQDGSAVVVALGDLLKFPSSGRAVTPSTRTRGAWGHVHPAWNSRPPRGARRDGRRRLAR